MKRVSFKTVGCRLNQAETARMSAAMEAAGFQVVPFGEPCDVGVVHTCGITANAVRTCIRLARSLKRARPSPTVVLAGCAVEGPFEELLEKSGADLAVGQVDKLRLADILGELDDGFRAPRPAHTRNITPRFETTRALVKVQDGCDFHCAYCVVPHTRHAPVSRPLREIIDEVKRLAEDGYREVGVTGANLGCYRDGTRDLVDVLAGIEAICGVERIRLSSIELSTTERRIIDFMSASGKLCHSLHLPLQSGDTAVLESMGRRYTPREYRAAVAYAVEHIPGLGLGTDVMVGFPGESEEAFAETVRIVEELPFSNLHIFPYSRRPRTRAADMPNQVRPEEKKRRVAALKEIGARKRTAFARSFIGREVTVLIETLEGEDSGSGWTSEYVEAAVTRPGLAVNDIVAFSPSECAGGILRQ